MTERDSDKQRRQEAEDILRRAHQDSAPLLGSALQRSSDFLSAKGESDDPAEIWGKRVGRGLALIVGAGCLIYLVLLIRS